MIEVRYNGWPWNWPFQYCLGRIVAEATGFGLEATPLVGFPETYAPLPGAAYDGAVEVITDASLDLDRLLADPSPRRIVLDGFFLQYRLYRGHRDAIRQRWLVPDVPTPGMPTPRPGDVAVHVRRGDYVHVRQPSDANNLPASYYLDAIDESGCDRLFLVTDRPEDPFHDVFDHLSPILVHGTPEQDFTFLTMCDRIVLSNSSLSWWAGFLGRATSIVAPEPASGLWSRIDPEPRRPDLDLRVGESRYTWVRC